MTPGRWFILGLLAFGVVAGSVLVAVPRVREWPVPLLMWPLCAALVVEIALMARVRDGRMAPISMPERAAGVIGAAIIMFAIVSLGAA